MSPVPPFFPWQPMRHHVLCHARHESSARLAHEEAASLCRWALRVRQDCLGLKHLDTADTLRKLGGLVHRQGELEEAEAIYMRVSMVVVFASGFSVVTCC